MTNDELETRITRLETRCTGLTVALCTFLPGIAPAARKVVLKAFAQYCETTATQMEQDKVPPATAHMHLTELAALFAGLQGAVKQIEQREKI